MGSKLTITTYAVVSICRITTRIRGTVQRYGSGSTVLRELLTNAVDAGAQHFVACLDYGTYPGAKLLSPKLGAWQGPALLVFNDSQFAEDDWHYLAKRIGESSKVDKPDLLGQFGEGPLTTFSITDVVRVLLLVLLLV